MEVCSSPHPLPPFAGNPQGSSGGDIILQGGHMTFSKHDKSCQGSAPRGAPWGPFSDLYSLAQVLGLLPRSEGTGPASRCWKDRLLLSAASTSGTPRTPPGESEECFAGRERAQTLLAVALLPVNRILPSSWVGCCLNSLS